MATYPMARPCLKLGFAHLCSLLANKDANIPFDPSQPPTQAIARVITAMAKLPMVQRLAVLAAFQASVAIAYFSIIERSRAREGSFEKDGYNFWDMYGEPKHKREEKPDAEKSKA